MFVFGFIEIKFLKELFKESFWESEDAQYLKMFENCLTAEFS